MTKIAALAARLTPGLALGLVLGLTLAWQVGAADTETRQQRLGEAVRAMLMSLARDPLFAGMDASEWAELVLQQPPENVINFGLVVSPRFDATVDSEGIQVVAVTPGSAAANAGLRSGDRLRRIGPQSLLGLGQDDDGRAIAYEMISAGLRESTNVVVMEIARLGNTLRLEGQLERLSLPAIRIEFPAEETSFSASETESSGAIADCATLIVSQPPPRDFDLHRVSLRAINGDRAGATLRTNHYLASGRYTLNLLEHIPEYELSLAMQRFSDRRPPLDLDVELKSGMTYYVGARLITERTEQRPGEPYWEPLIWRSEPGHCRGRVVER